MSEVYSCRWCGAWEPEHRDWCGRPRASACLAPECPTPRLDLGSLWMLCLEHALEATQTPPAARHAPSRPDLRGRCWGDGLTCHVTAQTVTAHGTWCREHAPAQPKVPERTHDDSDERAEQLAVLAVTSGLGGSVEAIRPNLWAARSYGDHGDPAQVVTARPYARTTPARAVTVTLTDERVPRTARSLAKAAKGWSVRLRHVEDPPSTVLRAWRGPLLIVATWEGGSFATAWVQHSRGLPMALGARQAGALLKAA